MTKLLPLLFLCSVGTTASLLAQPVATDPVGAVNITLKGNSDTIVAVPLTPNPSYSGAISAAASAGANAFHLDVTGTTGWTSNQFAGLHYVRITSGPKNGMYYTITANSANRLTVDTAGDDLSPLAATHTFKILKYWTLGTLFPPASAGTPANPLTASSGLAAFQVRSQVLLPDNISNGINLSSSGSYFFTNDGGWMSSSTGNPSANDTVLWPDSYIIIRQPAAVSADVTWTSIGSVALAKLAIPLSTQPGDFQDNYVGITRPVDTSLATSGLETGFEESTGFAAFHRRDTLLLFDNSTAGFNKSAAKSIFRFNGNWYLDAPGNPSANGEMILAGTGFVIRKYRNASSSVVWTNSPSY